MFPVARAGFVGASEEVRKGKRGVAVQRREINIAALVKNVLRSVAVVKVNIQNGDFFRAVVAERLGGDGGVVEKAVSAEHVAGGVVSRRSAKREGGAFALLDGAGGGEGAVGGGGCGFPSSGRDGGFGGEGVVSEFAFNLLRRDGAHAAGGPVGCDGFALESGGGPFVPGGLEKGDEVRVVDAEEGLRSEVAGVADGSESRFADARENNVGAFGPLVGPDELPAG